MACDATSTADYSSRYIGMYTEMDNHGYRHDVPLKYTGPALWNIRFNLMVNDNDGTGRDATIEAKPGTFHSKDITAAPCVRARPL
jgi:hypothetical protein